MSIEITSVTQNSICANHGVQSGDKLVSVNGHPIRELEPCLLTKDAEVGQQQFPDSHVSGHLKLA